MNHFTQTPAAIVQPTPQQLVLLGALTVLGVGQLDQQLEALTAPVSTAMVVDGRAVEGLDTAVFAADRADLPAPQNTIARDAAGENVGPHWPRGDSDRRASIGATRFSRRERRRTGGQHDPDGHRNRQSNCVSSVPTSLLPTWSGCRCCVNLPR